MARTVAFKSLEALSPDHWREYLTLYGIPFVLDGLPEETIVADRLHDQYALAIITGVPGQHIIFRGDECIVITCHGRRWLEDGRRRGNMGKLVLIAASAVNGQPSSP